MVTILGAGLAGLSASYHIGHGKCVLYEKNSYATGHIHTEIIDGFTWDEGPHVSFTSQQYVKDLFEQSVNGELLDYPVATTNYYKGNWIPHPAQTNLFAIPQPLRSECLTDFLTARDNYPDDFEPADYQQWLNYSFGETFTTNFPAAYTRKYWTTDPSELTTNWVGNRVFHPNIEQVKGGYEGPLQQQTHYIKTVRYPDKGGFVSFAQKLLDGANVKLNTEFESINFDTRTITFNSGEQVVFDKLINTVPLPVLIAKSNAPQNVKQAAENLNCSAVLLVNITARHATARPENWIYVYDEDKYSTRINCTELLSPNNAPTGHTGVQVEVYFSAYRPKTETDEVIADRVIDELIEMGLIRDKESVTGHHTKWVQWANVIFDHQYKDNLNTILNWLSQYGLAREADDLEPMTVWENRLADKDSLGDIILAGRFGQWRYYWTDDCVLRGLLISQKI